MCEFVYNINRLNDVDIGLVKQYFPGINDTKNLSDLAFLLQRKLHKLVVISLTRLLKIDYYIGTVKRPLFTFSKPFPG